MLFDGVKQTKDGFEIKVQSREKALEQVARHLGMFKDKMEVTGKDGSPLLSGISVSFVKPSDAG